MELIFFQMAHRALIKVALRVPMYSDTFFLLLLLLLLQTHRG
jgi:hypothetical protein